MRILSSKSYSRKKGTTHPMFDNYWWFRDLMHNFLLIENQIPLFIPSTIYNNYYCQSVPLRGLLEELNSTPLLTQKKTKKEGNWKSDVANASRLLEYGVNFELVTSSLVQIQFTQKDRILTIPQLKVNELTETLFRNLLAFEQLGHLTLRFVGDCIIFMDSIIDTPKDVNILIGADIIDTPKDVNILMVVERVYAEENLSAICYIVSTMMKSVRLCSPSIRGVTIVIVMDGIKNEEWNLVFDQ